MTNHLWLLLDLYRPMLLAAATLFWNRLATVLRAGDSPDYITRMHLDPTDDGLLKS